MKKFALYIILGFLICSCSSKQEFSNGDLKKLNLNGSVKSVYEEHFEMAISPSGELVKTAKTVAFDFDTYKQFNNAGFIVLKRLMNPDGTQGYTYTYEYNDDNQLVKETKYTPTENIDKVFVYTYNGKELDAQTEYSALGSINYIDKYLWQNGVVSVQESYEQGNLVFKWTYEYDQNGNMTKKTWITSNGTTENSYIYNIDNQLTEMVELNESGLSTRWQYAYDENGNITLETCTFSDETVISTEYSYQYDSYNNWIIRTMIQGEFHYLTERHIEYY